MIASFWSLVVAPFDIFFCLRIWPSRDSYFSLQSLIRAIISSWLGNSVGNFVFLVSLLKRLSQSVKFILVLSPPTLRGIVCSISNFGSGPIKSDISICLPVYKQMCPCSSHRTYFKTSTSVGSISFPVSALKRFFIFLRASSFLFWFSFVNVAIALRLLASFNSRANSIWISVSWSILPSSNKRFTNLRNLNIERIAIGLRTLSIRGDPSW